MNVMGHMSPSLERETAVSERPEILLEDESVWSMLLGESGSDNLFSALIAKTALHDEPMLIDPDAWPVQLWGQFTPMAVETPLSGVMIFRTQGGIPEVGPAETVNTDRLTLLARKYAASEDFSKEGEARLAILTERLRRLIPAVTERDVAFLENTWEEINRISESDIEIRRSLGIDKPENA